MSLVVARDPDPAVRAKLEARVRAIDPSGALARRVQRVEVTGPITWSKYQALVADPRAPGEPAWLITPLEPRRDWAKRHHDWDTVQARADASGDRYATHVAPFDFDAGDFVVDARGHVLVDSNVVERSRRHGLTSKEALRGALGAWLRAPVLALGDEPGDTPHHHLATVMTPLDGGVMLVGDPRAAEAVVGTGFAPGEASPESGRRLRADVSPSTVARFNRFASEPVERGGRVETIPNVPFDDKTFLSYTNAVFEVRGGDKIDYLPVHDPPALDALAIQTCARRGWTVRPIRVRQVYAHRGTLGCRVHGLARA